MIVSILTAALVVAGISSALALVISLIDLVVNNYGEVRIDINDGKKNLTVKGGAPLLGTLGENGIFIPSSCGGRATCGVCKVKVLSDVGPHLPTELPFMSQKEIADNIRLSCQIKLKADIRISIPDELFAIERYRARVEKITPVTYDTEHITLALLEPSHMTYQAGQFAQLAIPPYEDVKGETIRAYSFASPPSSADKVEFIIRYVPGGLATTYVHRHLTEGQELAVIGPMGEFGLHEGHADMICIAGGSGLAPIRSILIDMHEKGIAKNSIWFFFGAVAGRDLYAVDEFHALEKAWPIFHFVPALSAPAESDKWEGETGLITQVTEKYMKEKMDAAVPKEAYLCGSPGMIDASIKVLRAGGVPDDRIYYDKFS
ncbi:MAG TPA: 2Fe-2S iron-sulfur cluster binding domain-containing protein [Spirochaetia bacterium]|nr:2Fe-2S iron-sulfur cluster binding domain-containing protein [Spirochaetia bacterium]